MVLHEPLTNLRPVIFLQFAPGAPQTEIWRGLNGASSLMANCGKIVIAVSDDIHPSNADAVFWSLAYRCNPIADIHIAPYRQPNRVDKRTVESTLLVDATRKGPMPPLALPTQEFMARAKAIWEELDLGPLTMQPPWHGFSLGDWHESWERSAQAAAAGDWKENGEETLARQRDGLNPETSVRSVEDGWGKKS